jgi:hypothetical protein
MIDTAAPHLQSTGRSAVPPSPRPTAQSARIRIALTALLLATLTAVVVDTLKVGDNHSAPGSLLGGYAVAWTLFAAAVWTVRKVAARAVTVLVLIGAAAVALAGLTAQPRTSNDMYRYAWDGRVQAAGISPYSYPSAAPELARLRDH